MADLSLEQWRELVAKLAQPFDTMEFLPRAVKDGRGLAIAYIDARDVQRRLNSVCGADWSFDFELLAPDGKMVKGILTVCGVTRCDAGESSTEDEPLKSAVSDALKRTAVHFGIGQYLYYLPQVWAPYDAQKRRWAETPRVEAAVVSRAVALAIGQTLGEPTPYKPSPLPNREEAAANQKRSAEAAQSAQSAQSAQAQPESRGDRRATSAERPAAERPGAEPPAETAEPGRNHGKTPEVRLHNHYLGQFTAKFGKLPDDLRHAVEAILTGKKQPLASGAKAKWGERQYDAIHTRMAACDREDVLAAARELLAANPPDTAASSVASSSRERSRATPQDHPAPGRSSTAFGHL